MTGWFLVNHSRTRNHSDGTQNQDYVNISLKILTATKQADEISEQQYHTKFQGMDFEDLITKIKNSTGQNLKILCTVCKSNAKKLTQVTLEYIPLEFPPMINISNSLKESPSKKYVFVHSRYGEQLSKNTRAFLSLCAQAGKSGRKVVMPFVHQTEFSRVKSGHDIGIYYDVEYLKRLLATAGYASVVDNAEYEKECPHNSPNHVSIHFIDHTQASMEVTRSLVRMEKDYYNSVLQNTTRNGWTNCDFLDRTMKRPPGKQFCINADIIRDWKVLENDIVKNEKCLILLFWKGREDGRFVIKFSEDSYQFTSIQLALALRPGQAVMKEVERFKETLTNKYIAVYVRGEKILRTTSMEFLSECVDLLLEVGVCSYSKCLIYLNTYILIPLI